MPSSYVRRYDRSEALTTGQRPGVVLHGHRIDRRPERAECDVWGVTRAAVRGWPNDDLVWAAWFDMHRREPAFGWMGHDAPGNLETLAWYRRQSPARPIFMIEAQPDIPASRRYPIDLVDLDVRSYAGGPAPFGCTLDYLLALAWWEGRSPVVLNGIGTPHDVEHQFVHRTIWFWLGLLRGAGARVVIDPPCHYQTLTESRYGYDRLGFEERDALRALLGSQPADTPATLRLRALAKRWRAVLLDPLQYSAELDAEIDRLLLQSRLEELA